MFTENFNTKKEKKEEILTINQHIRMLKKKYPMRMSGSLYSIQTDQCNACCKHTSRLASGNLKWTEIDIDTLTLWEIIKVGIRKRLWTRSSAGVNQHSSSHSKRAVPVYAGVKVLAGSRSFPLWLISAQSFAGTCFWTKLPEVLLSQISCVLLDCCL